MLDAVRRLTPYAFALSLGVAAFLLAPSPARAATCVVNASSLTFGAFDVYGGAVSGSGTIGGTCNHATGGDVVPVTVTLGNGGNFQAGTGNRGMTCPACTGYTTDVLQYQLYKDGALSTPWIGATAASFNACPSHCTGSGNVAWSVTVYGQIFTAVAGGMNDVAAPTGNSYGDSVLITLNY